MRRSVILLQHKLEGDPSTFSMTCKVMKRGGNDADRAKDMVILILEDNDTGVAVNPTIKWDGNGEE